MFKIFKDIYPNFADVVTEVIKIAELRQLYFNNLKNPDGQIAIQNNQLGVTDWASGIGTAKEKTPEWEHNFCHLQPSLKGTVIEDYIKWLDVPVFRTRIMLSRPKSCYSIHKDYSPRLHLPLITNKQCNFLLTDPLQLFHLPSDGKTTWVDTTKQHTFMNGSTEQRLHLVMIVEK